MKKALLAPADIAAIRAALKKENPAWERAFTENEFEAFAQDAVADCMPGVQCERLRAAVIRTASIVAAECGVGQ